MSERTDCRGTDCRGTNFRASGPVRANAVASPERCPYCNQTVAVRKNGRLRRHKSREAVPQ